jgi:hypothetical protein
MKQAGNNPFEVLGLLNQEGNVSCSKYGISGIGSLIGNSKTGNRIL